MRRIVQILLVFCCPILGVSQSDTSSYFGSRIFEGVYLPDTSYESEYSNCFYKNEKLKSIWRETQYKDWKTIQSENIDLDSAYDCPEFATELYGKELEAYQMHYDKTEEERVSQAKRIDEIAVKLLALADNQNPLVQCKVHFLLGHQLIWFKINGRKKKINFLKKYITILDSFPKVIETGENFGPNLLDYRNTLRTLLIATAKFDDKNLGSFYLEKMKQTYANEDYSDELILDAAYYYGLKENQDSSLYYLNQIKIKKSKYKWHSFTGYFDVHLLNWLNNHFDPYSIRDTISEFQATIPDSLKKEKSKNEIKFYSKNGSTYIDYQYYPNIDGLYRIVKFKYKKYEALLEASRFTGSNLLFEKDLLKKITYWNHLKSRLNSFKRFSMEYDKNEMVRKLFVYTGVYHIMVIYNKKNQATYYIDRKKVKQKIAFPMIKKYFLEEGLSNFFTYHIPGGYEEMNGL